MKKLYLIAVLAALPICAAAQENVTLEYRLDSVVVSATRAGEFTPVTHTSVGKAALRASNPMGSLPMTLGLLPSVVTYNEGGTGLGNSAMTIRGVKGSQINVTLNGITLNDAESQEVFWVNIPALTALISNVQVQRGLGTSASGAGAFGASINMNTAFVSNEPFANADLSYGSYNTFISTVSAGTGLTSKGLYGSAAYSYGCTDGYIRNAWVRSQSAFVALGWLGGRNSLRLTYLMGSQHSGITWDGIDLDKYYEDRRYNGAGKYKDDEGNTCYYPNQSDNYGQHHIQLNYTHSFTSALTWTSTLNYTRGDGYDEYYKTGKTLSDYGLNSDAKSDIIYRKVMNNDHWVLSSNLGYKSRPLDVTGGIFLSNYSGGHHGDVLWAKALGDGADYSNDNWYSNLGDKADMSIFARAEFRPMGWLTAYVDLQERLVNYSLWGTDDDWIAYGASPADRLAYSARWPFFNPRAGVSASLGKHMLYGSVALGHREPGRSDIKENIKGSLSPIVPEEMVDIEAGWHYSGKAISASANIYLMEYRNMLLETGRLSSSGYAIKENVDRAWRRGIELAAAWQALSWLKADANATLSINRIADYTSYVAYDDYSARTYAVHYGETPMLMSPSVIGMARLTATPWKGGSVVLSGKYLGKQYIDNSGSDEMAIPAYFVADASVRHSFVLFSDYRSGRGIPLTAGLFVNNLFNNMYYASGWRWESYNEASGTISRGIGVYPQAPLNLMFKLSAAF
jgi:iron complex outermembrane receptor protein